MTSKTTLVGISGKMRHGKDTTCDAFIDAAKQRGVEHIVRHALADALKEECSDVINALTKGGITFLPEAIDTANGYNQVRSILGNLFPTGGINICDTEGSEILVDWFINDWLLYLRRFGPKPLVQTAILYPDEDPWIYTFNNPVTKPLFRKLLQWYGTEYRRKLFSDTYWVDKMEDYLAEQAPGTIVVASDIRFLNEAEFCRNRGGFLIRVWRPAQNDNNTHISETALDDYKHFNLTIENKGTLAELQQAVYHGYRLFEQWRS